MFRLKDTFLITHLITVQSSLLFAVKGYFSVDVRFFLNFHVGNWNMFLKNMGFLLNFWSHNKNFFVALLYLLCGYRWAMAVAVRNEMLVYYTVLHGICCILYFLKEQSMYIILSQDLIMLHMNSASDIQLSPK